MFTCQLVIPQEEELQVAEAAPARRQWPRHAVDVHVQGLTSTPKGRLRFQESACNWLDIPRKVPTGCYVVQVQHLPAVKQGPTLHRAALLRAPAGPGRAP